MAQAGNTPLAHAAHSCVQSCLSTWPAELGLCAVGTLSGKVCQLDPALSPFYFMYSVNVRLSSTPPYLLSVRLSARICKHKEINYRYSSQVNSCTHAMMSAR